MAGAATSHDGRNRSDLRVVDDQLVRDLVPAAISALCRRGADFASAEDAVQDGLIKALEAWRDSPPDDPLAWLITASWRRFLDQVRSTDARRARELRATEQPEPSTAPGTDDSLQLYFLCANPKLTNSSAVALTLRAVGGLTTQQIADAYLVPETTMAQRISRAKRQLRDTRLDSPGDLATVLRVLYLVFNEGYGGSLDLSAEAIRLTRQLASLTTEPEVRGLLALMLLHHARRASRTDQQGRLVPLREQDRTRWDTELITEGIAILQHALAADRLGEYQAQAAIAALHADAQRVEETDWVQIVSWYDELLAITNSPVVQLNRAIALGEADGAHVGLAALAEVDPTVPRHTAAAAYLHEKAGDLAQSAALYTEAASRATNTKERDHLLREAARLREFL
ncbi:RNA polymerase sigma factor [Flexivirga sp.]|uniref:RNA polymerase sigma factor n=1 Tax=Flexivirga sp. TaxID=1962927 RepID=UPI0039C88420